MANHYERFPEGSRNMYGQHVNGGFVHDFERRARVGAPSENIYHQPDDVMMDPMGASYQPHRSAFSQPRDHQHRPKNRKEILMEPIEAGQPRNNHQYSQGRTAAAPGRGIPQKGHNNKISPPLRKQQGARRSEVGICTKYTLFVVNFLIFVIGIGVASLGSYILYVKEKKVNDALDFFLDPSCDMCLVGCIFLFMGFVGLIGALRENTAFLRIHYYLMMLFLLVQISICVLTFLAYYVEEVKDKIFPTDSFREAIRKYRDDIDMQNIIDTMQKELKCCGLSDDDEGFLDWNDNPYFACANNTSPERCSVPSSCCKRLHGEAVNHQCGWKVFKVNEHGVLRPNEENDLTILNKMGCLKALGVWIDKHALVVGGTLLGVLIPQIIQIILTSNLRRMILLQKSRWYSSNSE